MSEYIYTTRARRSAPHDQNGTDLPHTTLASVAGFSTACGVLLLGGSWMMAISALILVVIATFSLLTVIEAMQRVQALMTRSNACPPRSYVKKSETQEYV